MSVHYVIMEGGRSRSAVVVEVDIKGRAQSEGKRWRRSLLPALIVDAWYKSCLQGECKDVNILPVG